MAMRAALAVVLGGWLALAAGCGSSRRSEPVLGPPPLKTQNELHGEVVFMKLCNQCHPGTAGGLGPGLSNKPAPAVAMRLQIRQGLGTMPAFPEKELSDADMDAVIDYMLAMRRYESKAD